MKTLKYILFLPVLLALFSSCNNNDNNFYNAQYASVPNLISIETLPTYSVNSVLWIKSTSAFSRYLSEPNQAHPLDLLRSTGGALKFNFSYVLEKQIDANTWSTVNTTNAIIQDSPVKGAVVSSNDYSYGSCIYNSSNDLYEFRNGIKLLSTGVYRLSFGYNSADHTQVELRSESTNNNLFMNINSVISDLNSSEYYVFTVN